MDPFELLLYASSHPEMHKDTDNSCQANDGERRIDFHRSLLDPVDSIMLLADQASKAAPVLRTANAVERGPYFNNTMTSPINVGVRPMRTRAMSEPWLGKDLYAGPLKLDVEALMSMKDMPRVSNIAGEVISQGSSGASNVKTVKDLSSSGELPAGNSTTLPQMLAEYSSIYNKNGRVGIYTKDERHTIICRFREKRRTSIWKKKIRYNCRKNLADRRVRIKGRFVKASSTNLFSGDNTTNATGESGGRSPVSPAGDGDGSAPVTPPYNVSKPGHLNLPKSENNNDAISVTSEIGSGSTSDSAVTTNTVERRAPCGSERSNNNGSISANASTCVAIDNSNHKRTNQVLLDDNYISAMAAAANAAVNAANGEHSSMFASDNSRRMEQPSQQGSAQVKEPTSGNTFGKQQRLGQIVENGENGDEGEEDGDEFDSDDFEAAMVRLPNGKRIRRHSIAF